MHEYLFYKLNIHHYFTWYKLRRGFMYKNLLFENLHFVLLLFVFRNTVMVLMSMVVVLAYLWIRNDVTAKLWVKVSVHMNLCQWGQRAFRFFRLLFSRKWTSKRLDSLFSFLKPKPGFNSEYEIYLLNIGMVE